MLNKNICMNCINKYREDSYYENNYKPFPWSEYDEALWKDCKVKCPHFEGDDFMKLLVNLSVNEHKDMNSLCPYKLEHLLKND
jgi:hypothetical protein